jgi:predicted anti-sigma-YlaC factor YlaD
MDHSLPFPKRWRLQLHLTMCEVCRHYENQLETIRTLAHRLGEEKASIESKTKLSPEAKKKIQQTINRTK